MKFLKTFFKIFLIIVVGLFVYEFMNLESLINQKNIDKVFPFHNSYLYNYEKLNDEDKKVYRYIYYTYNELYGEISVPGNNVDRIEEIGNYVMLDNPKFFYINPSFEYRNGTTNISFIPQYQYDEKEIEKLNQQIENNTKDIIAKAKQESDLVKRARLLYDYVVENVEYKENKATDQNIISSLIEKKSVCAGYARGYQYLLNEVGIKASYMTGKANEKVGDTAKGDGHAWVMINLGDDYYYCDPTWGDNVEKGMKHSCSGYFLMNSDEMLKCYQPDDYFEKTKNNKLNYFDNQSIYMSVYNETTLSNAIQKGLKNKTRVAEIKCANEQIYKSVKTKLDNTYLGYDILSKNNCYSQNATYAYFDELRLIELYY